ncbi:hypothetical protein [Rhodoplanes roseus]|uniref:hypothetical protein n=1 Tax=Rhodoplanes roseus TaxID=29409 RepID=UPI001AECE03A|nr:hypothetical protein [Rhodoplanes roseus]
MGLRVALLALAVASMLCGLWGGLWRIGFDLPHGAGVADLHGALLICGLFGTVIGLERAVAFGRDWAFAAPAFAALGSVLLLGGAPPVGGASAYALSALTLAGVTLVITVRQPALFNATLEAGALAWLAGTAHWMTGAGIPEVAGWWLGFLILTIAGERLELGRLMEKRRGSEILFGLGVALLAVGAWIGLFAPGGAPTYGLALLLLTVWLVRHDVVRHTIRQSGQTRFMAACMAAGYAWLGAAGVLLIAMPPGATAFGYDAALHAVLIGFVLSMVFGHALIILPAVARVRIAYRPLLYGPLAVLHASVLLRIGGDVCGHDAARAWSGPLTLVALLGFVALIVTGVVRRRPAVTPGRGASGGRPGGPAPRSTRPHPANWRGSGGRSRPK